MYYHIVDMLAEEVLEKNISLDSDASYLPVMTLLEDNKGDGASHIYMQKYDASSNVTNIVGIAIDEQGVGQASTMIGIDGQAASGEMQISQDGSKLAISNVEAGSQFLIKKTQASSLNTFNITEDHSGLSLNYSKGLGANVLAKSIAYTENGTYLYYASEASNGVKTLCRIKESDGIESSLSQSIVGGIIKGNDGNIYAPLENGEILMVSNTEAASPSLDYASSTSSAEITSISAFACNADKYNASTVYLGGNSIIKKTIFDRLIGNKMYELKDHLGNVRVVVSDKKLGTIGSNMLTDFVNVEELPDGTLKNTNITDGWTNGCASLDKMAGDCFVEYTITDYDNNGSLTENIHVMVGLSYENASVSYSSIDYNFYTWGLQLTIRENGGQVEAFNDLVEGDVLRLAREGTDIKYYLNGTLLRTTPEFQTGDSLLVDISTHYSYSRICGLTFGQVSYTNSFYPDLVSSTDYYPFGMAMPGRTFSSNKYRYGFNGMEKDDEMGKGDGNSYTTEFRQFDSRLGRWLSVDPMASSRIGLTPYNFAQNSPLVRFDPSGALDDVVIHGDNADEATKQLNESSDALTITRGDKGLIRYEGTPVTDDDKLLVESIDNHDIVVVVEAVEKSVSYRFAGAFMGNRISDVDAEVQFPWHQGNIKKVYTRQVVNTNETSYVDYCGGVEGSGKTILHEVTESYIGGLISQWTGVPATAARKDGEGSSIYQLSHDAAAKQPTINEEQVKQYRANHGVINN